MNKMITHTFLVIVVLCLTYFLLCRQLDYYMSPKDPLLDELKSQLSGLHPKFEHVELYQGDKTYTINKKKVYVCLKDEHGRYYNRNMLVYAICHEYAHVLCDEIGHTDKFFRIFEQLLKKATEQGLYDPNIPPLQEYCGHK